MNRKLNYAASFYLGFALAYFGGITFMDWRFWAIALPPIVIYTIIANKD